MRGNENRHGSWSRCLLHRGLAGLSWLFREPGMFEQVPCRRPHFVVELKAKIEEVMSIRRDIARDGRFRSRGPNLNYNNNGRRKVSTVEKRRKRKKAGKRTLKIACIWFSCAQGCSPVNISTMRHPTLQMSAFFVYVVCLTTSGAIQKTEPWSEGRWRRFPGMRSTQIPNANHVSPIRSEMQC